MSDTQQTGARVTTTWWRWSAAPTSTDWRVALATFVAALFTYLSNMSLLPLNPDSLPNAFLPVSVLEDGDMAFSPFEAPFMFVWSMKRDGDAEIGMHVQSLSATPPGSQKAFIEHYRDGELKFRGPKYYLVPTVRERASTGEPLFVGTFGFAAGLTALPLAALAHLGGVRLADDPAAVWGLAKLTAAMLAAGSVMLIYLTAVGFVPRMRALLLAGAYALGTCIWAVSSQSLWQQTPEIFLLSLGVFCLLRIPKTWVRGAAAGLAFSAAAACRPTAALVALVVAGWLLVSDRRALVAYVLAALPLALATLAYNTYYFGAPFDFGQLAAGERVAKFKTGSADVWQTPFWRGAAGLLFSPSRGMLIYSPILAAAFAGAVLVWRDPRYREMRWLTFAVIALWTPAFLWFDWWGGWAYGYRPLVDSVPLLAVLCLPALASLFDRPVWRAVFVPLLAWSVLVQGLGAFAYSPWGWNVKVIDSQGNRANVDLPEYRDRLWSFRDWQIAYLIANFQQARAERAVPVRF